MIFPPSLPDVVRERDLNAKALLDNALMLRDLQTAIRQAIEAVDRKSYETARQILKQALDESPWPQTRRER
jgi:RNA polymerase-interacting CarD/CdnL/TRCF family regulator